MFAPGHESLVSCSSKFSLSRTPHLACCLRPFIVVGTVIGIEQSQQSAASAARAQLLDEHAFQSKRVITDAQMSNAVTLEPAFEHLLRDATICALRHAKINDRKTFSGLAENPSELRDLAGDFGIDVSGGGMSHRREFAKVTTVWKRAIAQADMKEPDGSTAKATRWKNHAVARTLDEHYGAVQSQVRQRLD